METQRICFAGFGGQGVLSVGKLLAYAAMTEGNEVSWCPSYGPEMRGGTANCAVVISEDAIGSPVVTKDATAIVVMNEPSLRKFQEIVAPGGTLIVNSSLISLKVDREDINVVYVPANEIAKELGNPRLMNMVLLGTLLETENIISDDAVLGVFTEVFGKNKEKFIPMNREAIKKGRSYAKTVH